MDQSMDEEQNALPEEAAPSQDAPAEPAVGERHAGKKKKSDDKMELYDWIQCLIGALVAGILIFMFLVRVVNVDGSSMWPTLHDEDMILTTNFLYTPKNGDVVVFQTDTYGSEPLVKRVIATGGQTVRIDPDTGDVFVDGKLLSEPYIAAAIENAGDFSVETAVPEGCLFLMGDNRNHSTDSRDDRIGFVDERCVIGKVLMVVFPSAKGGLGEDVERDLSRLGSIY